MLESFFENFLSQKISSLEAQPVGGGSINVTYRIRINHSFNFFCKLNSASEFPGLFASERDGLDLLRKQNVIKVPEVIGLLEKDSVQALLLEWITPGARTDKFWKNFGERLARMHQITNVSFGLYKDNYMGALAQSNTNHNNWPEFFLRERLEPQIHLAFNKGLLSKIHINKFESIFTKLHEVFTETEPCLLHGDLWSGNFMCDEEGMPVLIDPAVYFGHPAVDLAMTTLFGGFESAFYDSYSSVNPFPSNYREQWELANLYPLLIHLNLFGNSYLSDILQTINRY